MITLQALVMTAALATPGQAILLDFHSDYCGPCRDMQPTIQRLIADGYDVRNFAELFPTFKNGNICESSYAGFFSDVVGDIKSTCDDFVPPG